MIKLVQKKGIKNTNMNINLIKTEKDYLKALKRMEIIFDIINQRKF